MSAIERDVVFMEKNIQHNVDINQQEVELWHTTKGCKIETMEFMERLRYAIDKAGIKQAELARILGVSVQTINYWLTGRNKPNRSRIVKIAETLGCSPQWLEFGTEPGGTVPEFKEKAEKESEPFPSDKYALIPRYEAKTSTGGGYHNGDHVEISKTHAFRKDWIKKNNWREEDLCVVEASGHSMEPQIRDGDVLLVNMADRDFQSGKVYVLLFLGEGLRAKRVHRMADGRIRISSDNPDKVQFPDECYSPEEAAHLNIVGKVVQRAGEI